MESQFLMKKDEYNYAIINDDILRIASGRDKHFFGKAELQEMQDRSEVKSEGYRIEGNVTYETYDLTEIGKVMLTTLGCKKNIKPLIKSSNIAEIKNDLQLTR